jgi:hypothetical protein
VTAAPGDALPFAPGSARSTSFASEHGPGWQRPSRSTVPVPSRKETRIRPGLCELTAPLTDKVAGSRMPCRTCLASMYAFAIVFRVCRGPSPQSRAGRLPAKSQQARNKRRHMHGSHHYDGLDICLMISDRPLQSSISCRLTSCPSAAGRAREAPGGIAPRPRPVGCKAG